MTRLGLVGPGVLGRTLAVSLPAELHPLGPILSRSKVSSRRAVREMKRGYAVTSWAELADADPVLIAVPRDRLAGVLDAALKDLPILAGKRLLIAGGAGADSHSRIERIEAAGAHVGCIFPIAIYRRPNIVAPGTTFAICGSAAALRAARELVNGLGGRHVVIDPAGGAQVLLGVSLVSGLLSTSLELAVRRLVRAGFLRTRAIESLAPLVENCIQEHRGSRQGPPAPRLPLDSCELLRTADAGEPFEAALCRSGLRLAGEDLR